MPPTSVAEAARRDVTAADRVIAVGRSIVAGQFRCGPNAEEPVRRGGGPMSAAYLVFPRNFCEISIERGSGPKVTSPATTVLYRRGDVYRRRFLSHEGDCCDYFMFDEAILPEPLAARMCEPGPMPASHAPVAMGDPKIYLAQRQVFLDLAAGRVGFDLEMEERVVSIVAQALARHGSAPLPRQTRQARKRSIEAVKEYLAAQPNGNPTLGELAKVAHLAPASLCRAFLAETGKTLTEYVSDNKILSSLQRLMETPESGLAEVAVHYGFSHHSHYTSRFSRLLGMTPSAFRRERGLQRKLQKA